MSRYLFLRRPPTGLLANQWEFPSIASTESTDTDSSANLPSADITQFKSYLRARVGAELLLTGEEEKVVLVDGDVGSEGSEGRVTVAAVRVRSSVPCVEPSILHIFSHERHTMAISIWEVDLLDPTTTTTTTTTEEEEEVLRTAPSSQPDLWIWMTADEIRKAGITTGCKKILLAAERSFRQHLQPPSSSSTTNTTTTSKKRVSSKSKER